MEGLLNNRIIPENRPSMSGFHRLSPHLDAKTESAMDLDQWRTMHVLQTCCCVKFRNLGQYVAVRETQPDECPALKRTDTDFPQARRAAVLLVCFIWS